MPYIPKVKLSVTLFILLVSCEPAHFLRVPESIANFSQEASSFDTPFPSVHRTMASFLQTYPHQNNLTTQTILDSFDATQMASTHAAQTTALFFPFNGPLPYDHEVKVINLNPRSEHHLQAHPVDHRWIAVNNRFSSHALLVAKPITGVPFEPDTTYIAFANLTSARGEPAPPSAALHDLWHQGEASDLDAASLEQYRKAIDALKSLGHTRPPTSFTVFHTQDGTKPMRSLLDMARSDSPSFQPFIHALENNAWELQHAFPTYCTYRKVIPFPVLRGPSIAPEIDHWESSRMVVSVPRQLSQNAKTALVVRTGSGADSALDGRGPRDREGHAIAGTGIALDFASTNTIGISVDGPYGGLRNVTMGDEQFLVYNIQDPAALKHNLQQSAFELALLIHNISHIQLNASSCAATLSDVRLSAPVTLVGHSTGASIAMLMGHEPGIDTVILSGAGVSFLENILHKKKPIATKPLAELLLGYEPGDLHAWDPTLNLLQATLEGADPQLYLPFFVRAPLHSTKHMLVVQGVVDNYILPPLSNGFLRSTQIDVAGPLLDTTARESLAATGRSVLPFPVKGNVNGTHTTAVVHIHEDGIEDGHEVFWQTLEAKKILRCFMQHHLLPVITNSCE